MRTALGPFLRLWSTQTFSALGSSMTSFALVIWAYEQSGSALSTALLSISSYALYVAFEHFCRCAFRPLEQKGHYAHLRCRGGAHHRRRTRFAQHRCALRVMRGRGARLAAHSADERQLRRAVPHPHSRRDAGPRLRRAQLAAIFHHSAWVSPWWRARRYRLRAVHGSANTQKPFLLPVRHRQRLRRAFLFLVLGFLGVAVCLCFRRSKLIRGLEANDKD